MRTARLVALPCVVAVVVVLAQPRSTWDGAYTAAQADRGATLYAEHCARCHGDTLDGVESAPPRRR